MKIQKTNPAFSLDKSTAWHVVDEFGNVVHYDFTKRDCKEWIDQKLADDLQAEKDAKIKDLYKINFCAVGKWS